MVSKPIYEGRGRVPNRTTTGVGPFPIQVSNGNELESEDVRVKTGKSDRNFRKFSGSQKRGVSTVSTPQPFMDGDLLIVYAKESFRLRIKGLNIFLPFIKWMVYLNYSCNTLESGHFTNYLTKRNIFVRSVTMTI